MDFSSAFHLSTYSPLLLLLFGLAWALTVAAICRSVSRPAAVTLASVTTLLLVILSGEHIPVVARIAPKTFCFGNIALAHVAAFALPIFAAILTPVRSLATAEAPGSNRCVQ